MTQNASKIINLNSLSDEELISIANKGNMQAFDAILRRYEPKIFNLAFRITGDREDSSDVLQDTFMQVLKNLKDFRGDSKFSTWVYRVATNAALMKKRKEKKFTSIPLDKPIGTQSGDSLKRQLKDNHMKTPFENLEKKELKEKINKAIDELPLQYRLPLVLRDIDGFSNEKTAKILDITVAAVKSRLHRARLFIREKLEDYYKNIEEADNGY